MTLQTPQRNIPLTMQPSTALILIVDDEPEICSTHASVLAREGYSVDTASGRLEAVACFQTHPYDLVFVDITLGNDSGIDLLKDIKKISSSTQVVIFTGNPDIETSAEAVRHNAFDYLVKPVRREALISVTRHALSTKKLTDEKDTYRTNLDAIFRSVSDSIVMIDKNGKLVQFNKTAEDACGYCRDMLGSDISAIHQGCDSQCHAPLMETLHTRKMIETGRLECHSPDGSTRIVRVTATPIIDDHGVETGAVAIIHDESRLVAMEQSLRKRGQFDTNIIGVSEAMQQVYSLIEVLAGVSTTVLISGESGTGKELVAAALHFRGPRAKRPFIKLNCSALSEPLLESELFGHVRGAFTGAIADKVGRFQKADGGTLFLDEIGDISPTVQMRLLRVLQESEFERVGESTPIKVDVRIIAATNQNLEEKVLQGTFRKDLFYRLNVVCLALPALKERRGDIEPLVTHFITKFNDKFSKDIVAVSDDVMSIFNSYNWPGNVRELEHVMEHACLLSKTDIISVSNLPKALVAVTNNGDEAAPDTTAISHPVAHNLSIEEALNMAGGNVTRAAQLLGVCRSTIYRSQKKS